MAFPKSDRVELEEPVYIADDGRRLPVSVSGAVEYIWEHCPEDDRRFMAGMMKKDLITLHHGLGRLIRNLLGLWTGNEVLLAACGEGHPDDASGVIIEAFWERCREAYGAQKG